MKAFIKNILRPYYKRFKAYTERRTFKKRLSAQRGEEIKIVIGSSGIYEDGWIPSEAHFLNLLDEKSWRNYFAENEIDYLLAEHVWEHITLEDGKKAASLCYKFLKKGGRLRLAVPDGFHKSQDYIEYVKPGGHGAGADDHKILYNYKTFSAVFEESGFKVELLEYFDEKKRFIANKWNKEKGYIHRSIQYDKRNSDGQPNYTSIIIDAIKV